MWGDAGRVEIRKEAGAREGSALVTGSALDTSSVC